jgi:hypothetical protein
MTDVDQFHRELSVRGIEARLEAWWAIEKPGKSSLDDEHVVNLIRSHKVCRQAHPTVI